MEKPWQWIDHITDDTGPSTFEDRYSDYVCSTHKFVYKFKYSKIVSEALVSTWLCQIHVVGDVNTIIIP